LNASMAKPIRGYDIYLIGRRQLVFARHAALRYGSRMEARKQTRQKVFVQGGMTSSHSRRILEGVALYGHGQVPPWNIRWGGTIPPTENLRKEGITGLVLFHPREEDFRRVEELGVPAVQTSTLRDFRLLPNVLPDNQAIGRMAAGHLLERQYQNFAFIGFEGHGYSDGRLEGFREGLGDLVPSVHLYQHEPDTGLKNLPLRHLLGSLPGMTAIFVANDYFALRVVECITELGRRIPQDLAVLGVDDDPLEYLASPVTLSSIDPNSVEIGRLAAQRLQGLMLGETDDGHTDLVPPKGVILRDSTDHWADADEMVGQALSLLRQEACGGLTVDGLCVRLGIGRRMFERRFRKVLGKTPEAEMRRIRLERAAVYLANTAWPVEEVAAHVGYNDPLYFSAAFRKAYGLSPRKWRNLPPEERPRLENA